MKRFLRDLFTLGYRIEGDGEGDITDTHFVPEGAHQTPAGEACMMRRNPASGAVYHSVTRTVGSVTWETGAIGQCPASDALGDVSCRCGLDEIDMSYERAEQHSNACEVRV